MDAAELGLTAVRGAQIAASLSAFGVAVFWSVVAPPILGAAEDATRDRIEAGFRHLFRASLAVAVAAALVWLVAQAAFMAEAESLADAAAAIRPVLTDTRFGHVLGARLLLLVLSAPALGDGSKGGRRALAAVMAGLALILQPWSAHAAAAEGIDRAVLLAAESLHLLAAGAWLGSLAPLLIAVGALEPDHGSVAARRFSPLGMLCVAILAGTALAQAWILIGGLPGLVGTDYGRVALIKLALLLVLLALAAANRFRYAPAMRRPAGADARRGLRRSIAVETAVGLLAVLAASLLADLPPALHQKPVWPFAWHPNFAVPDDPDFGSQTGERALSLLVPLHSGYDSLNSRPAIILRRRLGPATRSVQPAVNGGSLVRASGARPCCRKRRRRSPVRTRASAARPYGGWIECAGQRAPRCVILGLAETSSPRNTSHPRACGYDPVAGR